MNKTQKGAWFSLAGCLICISSFVYIFVQIYILKKLPEDMNIWPLLTVYCIFIGVPIILLRKKQSPHEVDKDERDSLIEKRAVIAAFVSVWILLFIATIMPRYFVGIDGLIPVWCIAFLNVSILFIAMLVYSVSVLVQYCGGGQDGKE